jgi:prophage regulatory protein
MSFFPPAKDPLDGLRLLTIKQVSLITGYSRNHIYRRIRAGTFPSPIRIGPNSVRWTLASIDTWLAEQAANPPERNPMQIPKNFASMIF